MTSEAGEQTGIVDESFVDNTLDLDDIPQIELPFSDDLSDNLKNLLRALLINQQNIINNCSFLYNRVKELGLVLERIVPNPRDPPSDGPAPTSLPSLYSVPEE